ncbi:DNA-binding GntR family transcriptional regulator [Arthrobacter sp. CAN_A6]
MSLTAGVFTKNDYAYAEVRSRILTGELEPGSVISQARLADELGVSTTPLREAIRRLAAEGMILLEAHRDARVTTVSAHEAKHLYEVRESVDPLAARLAAERRTDEDISHMSRALDALTPLRGAATLDSLMAHREFHRSIYRASGNPILIDMLEKLWDKADRYRLIGLRTTSDSADDNARVSAEHQALLDAVKAQDADRAQQTMRDHITHSLGRRAITALEEPAVS